MKKVEFSPSTFQFEIFRLTKAMTKQEGPAWDAQKVIYIFFSIATFYAIGILLCHCLLKCIPSA